MGNKSKRHKKNKREDFVAADARKGDKVSVKGPTGKHEKVTVVKARGRDVEVKGKDGLIYTERYDNLYPP